MVRAPLNQCCRGFQLGTTWAWECFHQDSVENIVLWLIIAKIVSQLPIMVLWNIFKHTQGLGKNIEKTRKWYIILDHKLYGTFNFALWNLPIQPRLYLSYPFSLWILKFSIWSLFQCLLNSSGLNLGLYITVWWWASFDNTVIIWFWSGWSDQWQGIPQTYSRPISPPLIQLYFTAIHTLVSLVHMVRHTSIWSTWTR